MSKDSITLKIRQNQEIKFELKDILYIKADRNYSEVVYVNGKSQLLTKPLAKMEQISALKNFERIHRSYIVNTMHINGYKKGRKPFVTTVCGKKLPLSPSKIACIECLLVN